MDLAFHRLEALRLPEKPTAEMSPSEMSPCSSCSLAQSSWTLSVSSSWKPEVEEDDFLPEDQMFKMPKNLSVQGGSRLAPCPAGRVTLSSGTNKSWKSEGDRNMSPNVDPKEVQAFWEQLQRRRDCFEHATKSAPTCRTFRPDSREESGTTSRASISSFVRHALSG